MAHLKQTFMDAYDDNQDNKIDIAEVTYLTSLIFSHSFTLAILTSTYHISHSFFFLYLTPLFLPFIYLSLIYLTLYPIPLPCLSLPHLSPFPYLLFLTSPYRQFTYLTLIYFALSSLTYLIIYYLILPYHIWPYIALLTVNHLTFLCCPILPYLHIWPYFILTYLSYLITYYLNLQYLTLAYLALSYSIIGLPYLTLLLDRSLCACSLPRFCQRMKVFYFYSDEIILSRLP